MKKTMFLLLSTVLVLMMTVLSVSAVDVQVNDCAASRGQEISFSVSLADTVVVGGGSVEIDYDASVLSLVSGEWSMPGAMMTRFDVSKAKGVFAYMESGTAGGGVFTATFKVLDTAALGQSDVNFILFLEDADLQPIAVQGGSATVNVACPHTNAYYKAAEPSTCKAQGHDAGVYCPDCETYTSGGALLAPVDHTYVGEHNGWVYSGSKEHERQCAVCLEFERAEHDYGDWYPNDKTGEHDRVCYGCGHGQSGDHVFDAEIATSQYQASEADCDNAATYYYSCSVCGLAGTNTFSYGTKLEHVFGETVHDDYKVSDASCESAATYYKSCVCGETSTETFTVGSPLPHEYQETVDDAFLLRAADCLNAAVYYKSCACGKQGTQTFTYGTELGHDFATQYTATASEHYYECQRNGCTATDGRGTHTGGQATCSAQATCDVCGESYGALAGHVYDQEKVEDAYLKSAASCMQAAVYYKSCQCGAVGTKTFSYGTELGHDFAKTYSANANYHYYECLRDGCNVTDGREKHAGGQATCSAKAICDACQNEYGSKAPHNYGEWSSTGEDEQKRQCQDCFEWEYTEHNWDTGVVTTPATESTPGEKLLTCLDCGETKTVDVPALTHKHVYGTEWKHTDEIHWYECLCGDRIGQAAHTWTEEITQAATCESTGVKTLSCSFCGYSKTEEIPLGDHAWDAGTVTTQATEQTPGVMTYVCTVCREAKTEEIPVLEHTHATAEDGWTTSDTHHWIACSCGDRIGEQAHAWVEAITLAASCESKGIKTYTCSVCGYSKTEELPALGHSWNEGEMTVEATEEAAGVKTYTCTACGSATRTEEIPQLEPTQTPEEPGEPVTPEQPERPCMWLFWLILLICIIIILLVIIIYMKKKDRYR